MIKNEVKRGLTGGRYRYPKTLVFEAVANRVCNVLSIYRDGGETPTDPHYSTAPAGSSCPR